MRRREVLVAGAVAGVAGAMAAAGPVRAAVAGPAPARMRRGVLMIVGGAEDRSGDRRVLRRFVEACGGAGARIAMLTAASGWAERAWARYDAAFGELGAGERVHLDVPERAAADDPALVAALDGCDGLWITGGNQLRLTAMVGGSALEAAVRRAHRQHGLAVAGTSAGAAVMSRHMLAGRELSPGFGLVPGAIVDQHFNQRRRLGRLLRAVAGMPALIGIGVDEDTALLIDPGRGVEVVGSGEVTLVDARALSAARADADPDELLALPEVQVHRLPAGEAAGGAVPIDTALRELMQRVTRL